MSNQFLRAMPRYHRHRQVSALQISTVVPTPRGVLLGFVEQGYAPHEVDDDWYEQHEPQPGGYLVCYPDGSLTYSRKEVFEDRYRLITHGVGSIDLQIFSPAALDVLNERLRQIHAEGWTPEHDDKHDCGDMARAAAGYASAAADAAEGFETKLPRPPWPWDLKWWKPGPARRMLVKAAALLLAEIERLDRKAAKEACDAS